MTYLFTEEALQLLLGVVIEQAHAGWCRSERDPEGELVASLAHDILWRRLVALDHDDRGRLAPADLQRIIEEAGLALRPTISAAKKAVAAGLALRAGEKKPA